MNFLDETHFERQRQISLNLESFLAKLESQTSSFKNDIQRKLANQFNELFRKKDFDECIQNIRNRGLEEWVLSLYLYSVKVIFI